MISLNLSLIQWILIIVTILFYLYRLIIQNNNFFLKRGVKFYKPIPLFGIMTGIVFRTKSFAEIFIKIYNKFPTERFIGVFEFVKPVYLIRDPELIKQIIVKDFDHFVDHRIQVDDDIEPIFNRSLFAMKGHKWREMRSTLSPAFTGSKMRQMFTLIVDCSKNTANYIYKQSIHKPHELEMKDFFTRFTNDVIGTCAFGLTTDSLNDRDNELYRMGKILSNFEGIRGVKFFCYASFPKIMKFFKISLFEKYLVDFFRNLVMSTIKYRIDNNILRPDMINLLIQAQKGSLKHDDSDKINDTNEGFATVQESDVGKSDNKLTKWTDDDLTAQCVLFILGGFDTVSTVMCFMSYELSVNQDVQENLIKEIDAVNEELNGKPITYEIIQKMKYMDMVVSETMRRWPPVAVIDRLCTKETTLEKYDGSKIQLNQNDSVWFPVYAIQNDPKYFPNPNKFDPERFSDENKHNINPSSYIPFGGGPRNCIGSRFALMEVKAVFFEILSKCTFELSPKSQHPLKLKETVTMNSKNGFWFQCRKRIN